MYFNRRQTCSESIPLQAYMFILKACECFLKAYECNLKAYENILRPFECIWNVYDYLIIIIYHPLM